jgi:farnesyl diphosphate synthase
MTPPANDFPAWVFACQQRIETLLDAILPPASVAPQRLHEAMRYTVLGGGKRVRPLLAFAAAEVSGAPLERVQYAAAAVELVHVYSLVHDDLPAMDDDDLRRGKPTVHVEYDEATAILVGDALQSLAFEVLARHDVAETPRIQLDMLGRLAQAAGSRGMAGGQAIDLDSTGKTLELAELEFMHIHKTGALIRAATLLGAQCGTLDADTQARLDHYAKSIGLAFQVIDDVLDAEAPSATLGKTAGKDAAHRKPTYISLMDVGAARELANRLRQDAHDALEGLPNSTHLHQLADFVVDRNF